MSLQVPRSGFHRAATGEHNVSDQMNATTMVIFAAKRQKHIVQV